MIRIASVGVAVVLLLLTLFIFPSLSIPTDEGLCISSPNLWHLPRIPGWLIGCVLIFLSAGVINQANKKFNFIQEVEPMVALLLLIVLACNCLTSFAVSASTLMLFANAAALFILFSTYEDYNATRQFFLVASFASFGSMVNYAFLFMIPVYIGAGLLMKSFRLRELIAFIFGLAAPYWIVMGFGWVTPADFHAPEIDTVFSGVPVLREHLLTLISISILAIGAFILALYNLVKLFSRNSRLRCMHLVFSLMGIVASLAILFDFSNFTVYFGTVALWFAVEIASLFPLYELRQPQFYLIILVLLIFLPIYIIEL